MTKIHSCIAIDDDSLFLRSFSTLLHEIDWLKLEATFDNPIKGATAIFTMKPDIVFLDLDIPYVDGQYLLDWIEPKLQKMDIRPKIIVLSAALEPSEKLLNAITGFISKTELKNPKGLEEAVRRIVC